MQVIVKEKVRQRDRVCKELILKGEHFKVKEIRQRGEETLPLM